MKNTLLNIELGYTFCMAGTIELPTGYVKADVATISDLDGDVTIEMNDGTTHEYLDVVSLDDASEYANPSSVHQNSDEIEDPDESEFEESIKATN